MHARSFFIFIPFAQLQTAFWIINTLLFFIQCQKKSFCALLDVFLSDHFMGYVALRYDGFICVLSCGFIDRCVNSLLKGKPLSQQDICALNNNYYRQPVRFSYLFLAKSRFYTAVQPIVNLIFSFLKQTFLVLRSKDQPIYCLLRRSVSARLILPLHLSPLLDLSKFRSLFFSIKWLGSPIIWVELSGSSSG